MVVNRARRPLTTVAGALAWGILAACQADAAAEATTTPGDDVATDVPTTETQSEDSFTFETGPATDARATDSAESGPEVEVEVEVETVSEVEVETVSEVEVETESEVEVETESEVEVETVSDTSPETAADTPPEADVAPIPEAPQVLYAPGSGRQLYFLNNPEQLVTTDLGDGALGDHTLLRVTAHGACRSFFEHLNKAGRTIGFGIQVYNPGPGDATVTIAGLGWTVGIAGGAPFADALAGVGAAPAVTVAPGKSAWILRKDELVPTGSFFSGVLDFDVAGAPVIVNHIAYDAFAGLDGSTSELGYVQRVEPDGTHEARMYKGLASASQVHAELAFVIDDTTPAGALPVRVGRYDLAADDYTDPVLVSDWLTHIGPGQNAAATASDMVSFILPSWGTFDPFVASDGEGKYPNLGNWGVVVATTITVENRGTRARTVRLAMTTSPGAGAGLAVQSGADAWSAKRPDKDTTLTLGAVTIPRGEMRNLVVQMVLGGPSGGALRHAVIVE